MRRRYDLVFFGLSLSSSWGNGHATTYRALLAGLARAGRNVLFLERDVPWYRDQRDMPVPGFCDLAYYSSLAELTESFASHMRQADAVIIGSYVPEGVKVIDAVHALRPRQLCFYDIDTPVTLSKLAGGDEEYLAARQIPLFDIYYSFTGGPVLRRLEKDFGAQRALALYCAADAQKYRPTGEAHQWDLGYLGTYSPDRQPALERLLIEPARRLPQMRFVVAGPTYPEDIVWPANVERIDHLPPSEHASFYSRQRFTLNVTRADMVKAGWSPSVRIFEAAACNTPIISDEWPGLTSLLPEGEAVLIGRSSEDVTRILSAMEETRRKEVADAAHRIVTARHTGDARAAELIGTLGVQGASAGRGHGQDTAVLEPAAQK